LSRRDFLQVMGASLALAGLTACGRPPREPTVSYVTPPEKNPTPGAAWYATAMPYEGFARGVLAKSLLGRPIKLEGNPEHPESLGASDAVTQAAILSLYDPDRSKVPLRGGQLSTWEAFEADWRGRLRTWQERRGAGLAVLTEPTTSPTLLRELHALLQAWPETRWYQHTPLGAHTHEGRQPDFDFAQADVILALGADCLYQHPAALRYVRGFSSRRRSVGNRINLNQMFVVEPTLTLTGAQADFRLALAPAQLPGLLNALALALDGTAGQAIDNERENVFVHACARQLADGKKVGVCVVGAEMPEEVHRWADRFNRRFAGEAASSLPSLRSDFDPRCHGGLDRLVAEIERHAVTTVCVLGGNPVYSAPGDVDLAAALRRAEYSVHVGEHVDETAVACGWHLPEAHFLETWSDLRAYSGAATILQPLIEPLHAGRSVAEVLRFLRSGETPGAYELVRETWRQGTEAEFTVRWYEALNRGVVDEPSRPTVKTPNSIPSIFPTLGSATVASAESDRVTLLFRADASVLDGRWANNPWLQELPRPFTSLVWENAALIGADLAQKLGLKKGDVIACAADGKTLEAPVWILPGQAAGCVTLPLGYGRTHGGETGQGRGFSAYQLRSSVNGWQREGIVVRRTGRRQDLVCTQGHFTMEGRDLARSVTVAELDRPLLNDKPVASLFPAWPRDRYAWGMSIDLSTCFGCNACVIACQAENNIPVVGRDQVSRGREMHWIRVDRYFEGADAEVRVLHQPVTCMHCENAPCEVVCPVGATVHSSEGLNDMVYNRCVGTRYCSNNCPYKVRRFNFLDYRAPEGSPVYLQTNPDVTVRERGVMEKCSYCVQRINAARMAAEKDNRRIRDGDVRTACQQACPAEAIVFGDLNDPTSVVVQRKREARNYLLLGELDTRPRTSYLAKIVSGNGPTETKVGMGVPPVRSDQRHLNAQPDGRDAHPCPKALS
jgi:molybdopterin-containing oxidoreductase family iron-sulfur binding subunit